MNAKESLLLAWLLIASLLATPFSLAEETSAYESLVAPVLEAKCVACHGEEKQKGKLRMDSYAALLEGGSEGPSLVPGSLDDSLMIFRIDLPMDDDEHMPPDSKEQLTKEEIAMLQAWVSKGGTEEMKVADLGLDEAFLATVMKQVAAVAKPKEPTESVAVLPQAVREEAMATVSEMGASLMPIAQDTPQLRYYALNVRDRLSNADLGLLEPVASDMRWLDLGGAANVTDAAMPIVGSMSGLTKLHLQGTSVTDSGLAYLKDLSELTYLNLYGNAKVTDKGLEHLSGLKNLQRLYLWQSGVTPAGAEKLEKAIPGLVINLGWEYEKKKQEEKTPVTAAAAVEKEKNMKKDQPAGGAAASIKEEKKPTPAPEKKPVLPPEKKVVSKPAKEPAPSHAEKAPVATTPSVSAQGGDVLASLQKRLTLAQADAATLIAENQDKIAGLQKTITGAQKESAVAQATLAAQKKELAGVESRMIMLANLLQGLVKNQKDMSKPEAFRKAIGENIKHTQEMMAEVKEREDGAKASLKAAQSAVQAERRKSSEAKAALELARARHPGLQAVNQAILQAVASAKTLSL